MSREQGWFEILSEAAQKRDIRIDISSHGLADEEVIEIESWVKQHLGGQGPLTTEELAIWNAIEKKIKTPPAINNVQELVSVPLNEDALQDAIRDLELSTKQIKAKSRVLEDQAAVLSKFITSSEDTHRDDTSAETSMQRQREIERQQIFFLNGEIQSQLNESIRLTQDKLDRCYKVVRPTVNEKLKVDDRQLDLLETQTLSLDASRQVDTLKSRSMLNTLQKATILSLKARLDRIYIQELRSESLRHEDHDSSDLLRQTQDDLQSLYTDIEDVASMLIEKKHGARLKTIEYELQVAKHKAIAQDASQVIAKLENLTNSTDQLAARYESLRAHREALTEIVSNVTQVQQQHKPESLSRKSPAPNTQTHELDALLRHLNIHTDDTSNTDITSKLQTLSMLLSTENKEILDKLVVDAKKSADRSSTRLDNTLNTSNDHLIEAKQRNKALDDHIALAKARLESAYSTADAHFDARRRFVENEKKISR